MLEFIEFPVFSKRLLALAQKNADDVLRAIQNELVANPERGAVIQGTGGVRKARAADPERGKGKRGGFRYMYYYIEEDGQIFLLMLFNKAEQENLTPGQKALLKEQVLALKETR